MNNNNDNISHADMVATLAKTGADILATLTPEKVALWHMATGMAGEAGEFLDLVKKHVIYDKPLDIAHAIEEMGDLEFYSEGARQCLDINRDMVLDGNISKLGARYKNFKYSNDAAINQADKNTDPTDTCEGSNVVDLRTTTESIVKSESGPATPDYGLMSDPKGGDL